MGYDVVPLGIGHFFVHSRRNARRLQAAATLKSRFGCVESTIDSVNCRTHRATAPTARLNGPRFARGASHCEMRRDTTLYPTPDQDEQDASGACYPSSLLAETDDQQGGLMLHELRLS
jgi:hypothetical protein